MRKGKDSSYLKLSTEDIVNLSDYCLQNASGLIEEAGILFQNKKYARSLALSVIGMEELGKRELLWEAIWLGDDERKWRKFWENFKSHQVKLSQALKNYLDITIKKTDTPRSAIDEYLSKIPKAKAKAQKDAHDFNLIKQWAFYVDLVEDKISVPSQYIPQETAQGMLEWAERYLEMHQGFKPASELVSSIIIMKNDMKEGEDFVDYWFRKRGLIKP